MKKNIYDIILNIRKKLPASVKKPLRWIYHKWNIKLDEEIIRELGEYYNLNGKEIRRLLSIAGRLNADFWYCQNPKTEEDVRKFYEDTPFYVLNLIFWHSTKYQRDLRVKFLQLAHGKVLDYGGGAGDLSLDLVRNGLIVDYADLGGKTFNFAKWLFAKNNCDINMINLSESELFKKYDTIFCIDVVEHVKQPKVLLKSLIDHLENNGKLIITALHPDISKDVPMHFGMEFNPEAYLNSLGMVKAKEEFLWIKR